MCRWMGSHFHYWIDYNGVAFSIELLEHVEWGHKDGVRKKWPRKVLSRIKFLKYIMGSSYLLKPETHKGLKRVTRVQCSWIFTFTIFGNFSDGYPFSKKWLPLDHHADVLRQEFCNTPSKDKKWKEKVQKNAQLSSCGEREAFHQEIVLRGIQPCFLHGGAHGLFWNATKAAKFLLNFQVHFALYGW